MSDELQVLQVTGDPSGTDPGYTITALDTLCPDTSLLTHNLASAAMGTWAGFGIIYDWAGGVVQVVELDDEALPYNGPYVRPEDISGAPRSVGVQFS